MTFEFYSTQVTRLQNTYGKIQYSAERVALFWEVVKDFPSEAFRKWIDKKIMDSRTPPMGEDFRDFANRVEKFSLNSNIRQFASYIKEPEEKEWKSQELSCKKCRDGGAVLAIRKEDMTNWTFVCDCPKGESSAWAEDKKIKDEPPFRIVRWSSLSLDDKQRFKVGE